MINKSLLTSTKVHLNNQENVLFINANMNLFQAEARAEFAERSVQKLQKEVDRLEGMYQTSNNKFKNEINFINQIHIT